MRHIDDSELKTIRRLIDSFFNGTTTLDEERRLYRFFAGGGVPAELECYRDVFADFGSLPIENDAVREKNASTKRRTLWLWRAVSGVAAVLLVAFALSIYHDVREDRMLAARYEGSYVIENGRRIDDLSDIRTDIEAALSHAKSIESHDMVGSTVEQAEQNVLNSIADPAERARINAILNE